MHDSYEDYTWTGRPCSAQIEYATLTAIYMDIIVHARIKYVGKFRACMIAATNWSKLSREKEEVAMIRPYVCMGKCSLIGDTHTLPSFSASLHARSSKLWLAFSPASLHWLQSGPSCGYARQNQTNHAVFYIGKHLLLGPVAGRRAFCYPKLKRMLVK